MKPHQIACIVIVFLLAYYLGIKYPQIGQAALDKIGG
jgi:hypothetical protein